MNETDLSLFVDIVCRYLAETLSEPPQVLDPTLEFGAPVFLDYSGFIRISGSGRGYVYLTMPVELPREVLRRMQETEIHEAALLDIVGEMTSTITSHAREYFGNGLGVSVPHAMAGTKALPFHLPPTRFVLPISWRRQQAQLGIALEAA